MGIVNLTDDSFSGDGLRGQALKAIAHGLRMAEEGADLLDLGAESSRPGAEPVSEQQEMDRLLPVIEGLRECGIPLSVDTVKPGIMSVALSAGADMINDIFALQAPGAFEAVAASNAAVCLMHMQGEPRTMQADPRYEDVVAEVCEFLLARARAAMTAGVARDRIWLDPGIGFGKTLAENLALVNALPLFHALGQPLLLGASRKRMVGALSNEAPAHQRLGGSVMLAVKGMEAGVQLLRVHDVPETVQAMRVWRGLRDAALTDFSQLTG